MSTSPGRYTLESLSEKQSVRWDEPIASYEGTREGVAMTELESPVLGADRLAARGYEAVRGWTYVVQLVLGDPEAIWRAMDSTARNRIRKAIKAGLTIEGTDDPSVADDFYEQYSALNLVKQKRVAPPYPLEYPRLLVRHLKNGDSLLALRGLRVYSMCGYGYFKSKFGGYLEQPRRGHKSYWASAKLARRAHAPYFEKQIRLRGWWQRVAHKNRTGLRDQGV